MPESANRMQQAERILRKSAMTPPRSPKHARLMRSFQHSVIQGATLALFAVLAILAVRKFRPVAA
jgi:hypothetical protein